MWIPQEPPCVISKVDEKKIIHEEAIRDTSKLKIKEIKVYEEKYKILEHLAILEPIQVESSCVMSNTQGIKNDKKQWVHESVLDRRSDRMLEHQVQHLKVLNLGQ